MSYFLVVFPFTGSISTGDIPWHNEWRDDVITRSVILCYNMEYQTYICYNTECEYFLGFLGNNVITRNVLSYNMERSSLKGNIVLYSYNTESIF